MAIVRLSDQGTVGTKNSNVEIDGMEFITEVSVEESVGSIVKAKDGAGDVKSVLIAKSRKTLTASGYGSATESVKLGKDVDGPGGFSGKITESSWEASSEDFTKMSITATGL